MASPKHYLLEKTQLKKEKKRFLSIRPPSKGTFTLMAQVHPAGLFLISKKHPRGLSTCASSESSASHFLRGLKPPFLAVLRREEAFRSVPSKALDPNCEVL